MHWINALTLGKRVPLCPLAKRLEFTKTHALWKRPGQPMLTPET